MIRVSEIQLLQHNIPRSKLTVVRKYAGRYDETRSPNLHTKEAWFKISPVASSSLMDQVVIPPGPDYLIRPAFRKSKVL